MTRPVLLFDVYGTLINTHGLLTTLQSWLGEEAGKSFSLAMRRYQLEYSWRRSLMGRYEDFPKVTKHAILHANNELQAGLSTDQIQQLVAGYATLPAFEDSLGGLKMITDAGFQCYAFSNGTQAALEKILSHANVRQYLIDVISCDEIKRYKPDPVTYQHACRRVGMKMSQTWLISCNNFDVLGAMNSGLSSAWIRRDPSAVMDPWDMEPTYTARDLRDFANHLISDHQ
eukprot:Clim_evm41s204 gene=Clim_evmTU41s204